MTKVVKLMMKTDNKMSMKRKAKETPTANASILVATSSVSKCFKLINEGADSSSELGPSRIIFTPTRASKAKQRQSNDPNFKSSD